MLDMVKQRQKRTIGSQLGTGFGGGFDFLRVFLALSVVFAHSFLVTGTDTGDVYFIWFMNYWVLAMFFGLSGFLIAGSAARLRLRDFLINRGIRIFPALAVEITLAVLVLGPIFTTLGYKNYFFDWQTLHYLTNIVGLVNYDLPGVFRDNPSVRVNTSLWTVPYELACYGLISLLIGFGMLKRASLMVALAAAICLVGLALVLFTNVGVGYQGYAKTALNLVFVDRGSKLFVCFLLGIAAYVWRDRIPYDLRWFVACVSVMAAISLMPPLAGRFHPALNLISAIPLTYIMLFVGVSQLRKLPFFHTGDYSYGIYLYGFPFQQAVYTLTRSSNPFINFLLAVPAIVLIAFLSWHLVEKPMVKLRRKFSFSAKQRLENQDHVRATSEPGAKQGSPSAA